MNELFPILSESHLTRDADLVAVEVVGFDGGLGIARRYFGFAFTAFHQIISDNHVG